MDVQDMQPTVVRTGRGLSIAGTRITLYDVMDYVEAEWPPALIQHWLNLTDQQIADVLTYIADHHDEVEAEYQQVLQHADEVRASWEERNHERLAKIAALPPKPGYEAAIAKLRARKTELDLA
ncbi:MAG: DUF433 domain-containing protein [Herpetosiphonaceae bacterium]|nr:DUF433 domain-containing protein [Herpetosiphonaceae bacterium]